jgi:hypothetical protein
MARAFAVRIALRLMLFWKLLFQLWRGRDKALAGAQ